MLRAAGLKGIENHLSNDRQSLRTITKLPLKLNASAQEGE